MLRKGVCPYEYMDGWNKFNEILFNEINNYKCLLQTRKRSFELFWIKKLRWLIRYVRAERYGITNRCIWKLPRQMCWSKSIWSSPFSVGTRSSIASMSKKIEIELLSLTDVENAIHWYAKADNKCMKD